jgi:hypothetical protein
MEYTICSSDPKHFNVIDVTLPQPNYKYATITVTNFVSYCHIKVLSKNDYIYFNVNGENKRFLSDVEYTNIENSTVLANLLQAKLAEQEIDIDVNVENLSTLRFHSNEPFAIENMSYNLKLLTGLYYVKDLDFPIVSVQNEWGVYEIFVEAVGYYLSTPVLYLVSNLGGINYSNYSDDNSRISGSTVLMRILNTFTSAVPIISANAGFSQVMRTSALSNINIRLVDANFHDVFLLSPTYVTISIEDASSSMELENIETYRFTREAQTFRPSPQNIAINNVIAQKANREFYDRFEMPPSGVFAGGSELESVDFHVESPPVSSSSYSSYSPPTNEIPDANGDPSNE